MTTETIREMLSRDPFEPFRIGLSSGESVVIRDPHTVAIMKSQLFVAHPRTDRSSFISLRHIVTVETLANGHTPRSKRQR